MQMYNHSKLFGLERNRILSELLPDFMGITNYLLLTSFEEMGHDGTVNGAIPTRGTCIITCMSQAYLFRLSQKRIKIEVVDPLGDVDVMATMLWLLRVFCVPRVG